MANGNNGGFVRQCLEYLKTAPRGVVYIAAIAALLYAASVVLEPFHNNAIRKVQEKLEQRITYHLSFGEKKLVSLATVLAMEPEVLLLDEPAAGLDEATLERITKLLADLPQPRIVISHDSDFLTKVTGRLCRLEDGRVKPA